MLAITMHLDIQLGWHFKFQQSSVIKWNKILLLKKEKKYIKYMERLDQNSYVNKNDINVDYTYS